MKGRKFTDYQLTDAMLQRLSAIVHERPHNYGTSLIALEERLLVEEITDLGAAPIGVTHSATAEGRKALDQARREGW